MLAHEIAWQRRHAVAVQWHDLSLSAVPGRPQHTLRLNRAGDTLLLSLPVLHGSPGLLEAIVPWLRRAAPDNDAPRVMLRASDYDWESGG